MSKSVEPQHQRQHPLVGDLVDYSDGTANDATRAWIAEHLEECDRCDEVVDGVQDEIPGIEPPRWSPASVPPGVVELLLDEVEDDPQPAELWLLDWDGARLLAVVLAADRGDHQFEVAIASLEDPGPDGGIHHVEPADSPLEEDLYIWNGFRRTFDRGVFLRKAGRVPDVLGDLEHSESTVPQSWRAASQLAELGGAARILVDATWLPYIDEASIPMAELMNERGLKPSDLARETGLSTACVRDVGRGVRQPTEDEWALLAVALGVEPSGVDAPLRIPDALAAAVSRPRYRFKVRARAFRDGVSEAAARLGLVAEVLAMPARTTAGERDESTWTALLEQCLNGD